MFCFLVNLSDPSNLPWCRLPCPTSHTQQLWHPQVRLFAWRVGCWLGYFPYPHHRLLRLTGAFCHGLVKGFSFHGGWTQILFCAFGPFFLPDLLQCRYYQIYSLFRFPFILYNFELAHIHMDFCLKSFLSRWDHQSYLSAIGCTSRSHAHNFIKVLRTYFQILVSKLFIIKITKYNLNLKNFKN